MNHRHRLLISLLVLLSLALSGLAPAAARVQTDAASPAPSTPSSSLLFIENVGQFAEGARHQVRGASQGTVWLAQDAIWLVVVEAQPGEANRPWLEPESGKPDVGGVPRHGAAIKLSFVGSNPQPRMEPFNRLETHVSYFLGSDPASWRADVPVWGGVRYVDLYPGIDLELAGGAGGLVPRLVAHPGADLSMVRMRVEGAQGVSVEDGMLRLSSAAGEASWPLLQAEGATGGALVQPRGVGVFEVLSPLQPAATQAVMSPADDPSDLLYSTFVGGSSSNRAVGIAVDSSGAAYITGDTYSTDFPTTPGAFDTSNNGYMDVFVAKLNATGSALNYGTYLGGSSDEYSYAIAVDGSGAAYIMGSTLSTDFPTTSGAFDPSFNGGMSDAFVVKLNTTGTALGYATFLGGEGNDEGRTIAVDGSGVTFIVGYTSSSGFPTTPSAFDTSFNGYFDIFAARLNAAGSALDYATFLGGSAIDFGFGVTVDGGGAAYVTGATESSDFPTTPGAFDTSFNGDYRDPFVVKLNAAGSALEYATFLGGSSFDQGGGIAVDSLGAAYVTGSTQSVDFPVTLGAFDTSYNGLYDAFVVNLNATGSVLGYASFLGGGGSDSGWGIFVSGNGSANITGLTASSDFPTTPGAYDTTYNDDGFQDGFAARLNTSGSTLDYSTFLGGSDEDTGVGIAVDASGMVYISGETQSADFPTTPGAFDTSYNGGYYDTFVLKLAVVSVRVYIHLPLVVKTP